MLAVPCCELVRRGVSVTPHPHRFVREGINPMRKYGLFAVCLLAAALLLAACGRSNDNSTSTSASGASTGAARSRAGGKIALLLPEPKTARYETQDRPLFEAKVKALCS